MVLQVVRVVDVESDAGGNCMCMKTKQSNQWQRVQERKARRGIHTNNSGFSHYYRFVQPIF